RVLRRAHDGSAPGAPRRHRVGDRRPSVRGDVRRRDVLLRSPAGRNGARVGAGGPVAALRRPSRKGADPADLGRRRRLDGRQLPSPLARREGSQDALRPPLLRDPRRDRVVRPGRGVPGPHRDLALPLPGGGGEARLPRAERRRDRLRTVFLPSLLNELCGDPGLLVDFLDEGRSVLVDLGELRHVASRKLLRVERAIVTHTHVDHFVGFDHLLRLCLRREKELVLTGPPGFLRNVRGKIRGYTWNLIARYPIRLVAEEVDGDTIRSELYTGAGGMEPEPLPPRRFAGTLHAERLFTMHGALFDHGIPVLGAALREVEHVSVNRDRLTRLGLAAGPWLRELKQAVRRSDPM